MRKRFSGGAMQNSIVVAPSASHDIAEMFAYLSEYEPDYAKRILGDFRRVLRDDVAVNPTLYGKFHVTGLPYRARLFRLSRRTQFWIVYRYDSKTRLVRVVRLWNASRNPSAFEL
jgi:plasmid stabilization system protein ParE